MDKNNRLKELKDIMEVKNKRQLTLQEKWQIDAELARERRKKKNNKDVYVLEIDGAHWEGRKEELLQILNDYKLASERESADFNFIFLPLRDYNKLCYLDGLK